MLANATLLPIRAVDNLIYVSACSPARNPSSEYQAWGHSSIVDPMGLVKATCDETESIVHGRIDIDELIAARKGLPVTTQRRFDVYPDVSKPL
ncbi:hypothetical protein PGT21_030104 [Puccinia graminis f. sp. tritici]|uniref:CN hydrolase domain-containing protein n=1 Tax=Puccinia graminis f. sp. tritici TaxID=56615 RepID=A0A5B0QXP8_PUCGR|nr:hypothetical protein PGT21_030104 [Puccinia graminis f. sp. tritici]